MKKWHVIIGIIVVAILASVALYVSRPSDSQDGSTAEQEDLLQEDLLVESDDGMATLEISGGALPDGVDRESIAITKRLDKLPDDTYAVYDLAPDGLVFAEPVQMTVTLPVSDGTLPLAFSQSGEHVEILDISAVSQQESVTTVVVELSHMSVLAFRKGPFKIAITPPEITRNVSETFTIEFATSVEEGYHIVEAEETHFGLDKFELQSAAINGEWIAIGSVLVEPSFGAIAPAEDVIVDPSRSEQISEEFESFHFHSVSFTCVKAGEEVVVFSGELTVKGTVELFYSNMRKETAIDFAIFLDSAIPVACIASAGEEEGVIGPGAGTLIEMLVFDGQHYPRKQFHAADPDVCGQEHWHADRVVYGIDSLDADANIVSRRDPDPGGCGFGTVGEVPSKEVRVPDEAVIRLFENIPD